MPTPQQSPPKRMTRARAKAFEDKKSTVKTTNVTATSTKATGARTAKRKIRTDDEDEIIEPQSLAQAESVAAVPEPSDRQSSTIRPKQAAPPSSINPKLKTQTESEEVLVVKRPRGRPRKVVTAEVAKPEEIHNSPNSNTSLGQRADKRNLAQPRKAGISAPPLRKKVTFDVDDSEKENTVRHPATPAKAAKQQERHDPALTQIAVNAKPVRRAAPIRGRGKKVANQVVSGKEASSQSSVAITQPRNEAQTDDHENDSDDLGDGRSPSKSNCDHVEPMRLATKQMNPAKLAGQAAAGMPATPAKAVPVINSIDELQESPDGSSPLPGPYSHIKVKTPGQRAAISAAKSTSKPIAMKEAASECEPKLALGKMIGSATTSIVQPPKKIQLEQPPLVPVFKAPAVLSKITGSPIRRPGASVSNFYPATSVKPVATPGLKSSIYGTPARKLASSNNSFAPNLSTNFPDLNKKSSFMHSPPRRPSSPERTLGVSTVSHNNNNDSKLTSSLYGSPARRPASPTKAFASAMAIKLAPGDTRPGPMASPPRRPISPQKEFSASSTTKPIFESAIFKSAISKSPERQSHTTSEGSPVSTRHNRPLATSVMSAMTHSTWSRTPERNLFPSGKMVTSAFKSSRSPEAMYRVHKMTPEEQADMLQDELLNAPSPFTPYAKSVKKDPKGKVKGAFRRNSHALTKSPTKEQITSPQASDISDQAMDGMVAVLKPGTSIPEVHDSSTTPPGTPSSQTRPIRDIQPRAQNSSFSDESEDELQADVTFHISTPATLTGKSQLGADVPITPTPRHNARASKCTTANGPMTALADRFSEWKGLSPSKGATGSSNAKDLKPSPVKAVDSGLELSTKKAISSPIKFSIPSFEGKDMTVRLLFSPEKPSQFDEAMAIREDPEGISFDTTDLVMEDDMFRQSQISEASQEYGDENAIPVDSNVPHPSVSNDVATCTPSRVFPKQPLVIHTVSKVPLKPSAEFEESPLVRPRRSNSLSGPLSKQSELDLQALRQIRPLRRAPRTPLAEKITSVDYSLAEPIQQQPSTPDVNSLSWSSLVTPARTPRPDVNSKLLSGCIVFVDVHTTEGADASGIFVELLTQMGARSVKQWAWNPRASSASTENPAGDLESTKVGITHVVFKDGGRRTMEKVREAKGLVICVGVGWVLDCERENKWLDESDYAIDTSTVPRGGHRRRKSMEPKALSNFHSAQATPILSPTKQFLNLDSPTCTQVDLLPISAQTPTTNITTTSSPPPQEAPPNSTPLKLATSASTADYFSTALATPPTMTTTTSIHAYNIDNDNKQDATSSSPTTPYFLHPQNLIQQTCPPKQSQQPLFPLSGVAGSSRQGGDGEGDGGAVVRRKLELARRKSLQWAPRVGSPLKGVL